jgi:hypothetical protein
VKAARLVIPGLAERENPESIVPCECWEEWIPGLALWAIPE